MKTITEKLFEDQLKPLDIPINEGLFRKIINFLKGNNKKENEAISDFMNNAKDGQLNTRDLNEKFKKDYALHHEAIYSIAMPDIIEEYKKLYNKNPDICTISLCKDPNILKNVEWELGDKKIIKTEAENLDLELAFNILSYEWGKEYRYTKYDTEIQYYWISPSKTCKNVKGRLSEIWEDQKKIHKKVIKDPKNYVIVWKDFGNNRIRKVMEFIGFKQHKDTDIYVFPREEYFK